VSLKQKVVELASNSGVLETIQKSAQACLQAGWSILLPTAEERARALSTLIGKNHSVFQKRLNSINPKRRLLFLIRLKT
jgi:E3 ubiquitin-protein ligase HERC2